MIFYISSQADGLFIFAYSSKNETKILRLERQRSNLFETMPSVAKFNLLKCRH